MRALQVDSTEQNNKSDRKEGVMKKTIAGLLAIVVCTMFIFTAFLQPEEAFAHRSRRYHKHITFKTPSTAFTCTRNGKIVPCLKLHPDLGDNRCHSCHKQINNVEKSPDPHTIFKNSNMTPKEMF